MKIKLNLSETNFLKIFLGNIEADELSKKEDILIAKDIINKLGSKEPLGAKEKPQGACGEALQPELMNDKYFNKNTLRSENL